MTGAWRIVLGAGLAAITSVAVGAQPPDCRQPDECAAMALEARGRGAYETFHDLAWRAVQTGRPNDPELMYLLARAQALSGRARDALIMLRRLAEAGVTTDAATHEDFRRVRALPGWREVEALAARAKTPLVAPSSSAVDPKPAAAAAAAPLAAPNAAAPAAATAPAPVRASAPTVPRSPLVIEPAAVEEAARFSTVPFVPAGLAYDAVSRRLVFGDALGRRLFVVGEGSARTIDLVRGETAGFEQVSALAVDARRGTLWVASTAADGRSGAVHQLQLISGRALAQFAMPAGSGDVRLVDIAVADDGVVFALDGATPRVLVLRPGAKMLEPLLSLAVTAPASLAVSSNGRTAYVAHADGITRLDLQARTAAALASPDGLDLRSIERLREYGNTLVALQTQSDGTRGLVRLQLNRVGRTVSKAALIASLPANTPTAFAAISGDDAYYLVMPDAQSASGIEVRVQRIRLR